MLYAALARVSTWVLMRLPFGLLRATCRLLVGRVGKWLHGRAAEQRLIVAFGDAMSPAQRLATLDAMFRGMADIPAEVFTTVHRGADFVRSRFVGTEGIEKWRRLQTERGGIVAITGHIGNWELLLQYLHLEGVRPFGAAVAKRITNPGLNSLVEELRSRFGIPTLYRESGAKAMARVPLRGDTIGLVPDQDIKSVGGTFVEFFGRNAYTPTGPARLALATGAPIVCTFAKRVGNRFELIVSDPIQPDRKAPREPEVHRLTKAWSDCMQEFVRAHPEQWMWLHDRWRTTPDDVASRRIE